ncbi:uncharacterized, partial [Tachysurus ichikawai]
VEVGNGLGLDQGLEHEHVKWTWLAKGSGKLPFGPECAAWLKTGSPLRPRQEVWLTTGSGKPPHQPQQRAWPGTGPKTRLVSWLGRLSHLAQCETEPGFRFGIWLMRSPCQPWQGTALGIRLGRPLRQPEHVTGLGTEPGMRFAPSVSVGCS